MSVNTNSLPPLLVPQHPSLSQLDPPTGVSFSLPLLLALLVVLGIFLLRKTFADRFEKTLREDKHSEALTALMAIFTPTKSSWPSDILNATQRASVSRLGCGSSSSLCVAGSGVGKGEIRLRFSAVYEHILNGDLELQPTASVDLVKAMLLERDGIEVDGWKIRVVVEWVWMWRVSWWIIKGLGSKLVNLSELWDGDVQGTSRLLVRTRVHSSRPIYALDSLPIHQHDSLARQLYNMLQSDPTVRPSANGTEEEGEKRAIVTFSTISAPLVLLSTVTLCGLPFFLRAPPTEPTPVFLGLRRAIKSLSSVTVDSPTPGYEGRLVVTSIDDTSDTYAGVLLETIKRMEGDSDYRQKLVDELGVRGWKREMFCLELEAALYRAGLMKRWEVLVGVS